MKKLFMLGRVDVLGGYETQLLRLSQKLFEKKIPITIITSQGFFSKKTKIKGIETHYLPSIIGFGIFTPTQLASALLFFLKQKGKGIIHAHNPNYGLIGAVIKILLGYKLIVKVPTSKMFFSPASGVQWWMWYSFLFSLMKKNVDMFVSLNPESKQELLDFGIPENRISFIPNGIDCKEFKPLKTKKTRHSAIFVGRLANTQKRINTLLKAWAIVVQNFPKAKLAIFGGNTENKKIAQMIKFLGIEKNVKLVLGKRVTAKDYCHNQIFISASAFEGMSNSLLEAMACGMPIVATKIAGTQEILENEKNALLTGVGNPQSTAIAIIRLFSNKKLARQLGKSARKKALEELEMGKIAEKYEELYNKLSK